MSAACGCTSTPPTAASRRSPSAGARRWRGIELADSVTLDPHKWLYQPYECGALLVRDDHILRAGVSDDARLPAGLRGRGRRGQPVRPRRAAHAQLARVQGVAVAAVLRGARVHHGDRPLARPRAARPRARRAQRRARAHGAAVAGHRLLSAPLPRRRRRRARRRPAQRRARRRGRGERARARLLDGAARALRAAHVRHEPHDDGGRRRARDGPLRVRRARGAEPRGGGGDLSPRPRDPAHAAAPPRRADRRRRRGAPTRSPACRCSRPSTTTGARASRAWRAWRRAPRARRSSSSGTRRWTSTSSSTATSRC